MGRLRLALRRIRETRLGVILLYHRVAGAEVDPWALAVSPRHFAEHMEVLARRGRPLGLADLAAGVRDGTRPRRGRRPAVAVTFDDGYADNLFEALPVLERHEIPATVFLASGAIGRDREFWWDELARLLLHPGPLPAALRLAVAGETIEWTLGDPGPYDDAAWRRVASWRATDPPPTERHSLYLALWRRLRVLDEAERERVLDDLAAFAGAGRAARPSHRPLSTAEAAALARAPLVEIGAHTVTHPLLSALPPASQRVEILASKAWCEALAGRPVTSFAYPFGNYTAETVAAVRDAGFARACSTEADLVRSGADPFELPRVQVADWDGEELERRLSGGFRP